jgi:protein-disulfide isomerase
MATRDRPKMNPQKLTIALAASSVLFYSWSLPALTQTADQASAPGGEGAIQKTIHDYILAHPEVLIQSLQIAKEREQERLAALTKSRIASFRKELVEDANAPILGNPAGDVTLVEFFDYRCPYCRQVEPFLQALVKSDPGLRIVEKEFPILGPASTYAARVALAANKQGKYKQFREAMMAKKPNIDEATVLKLAEEAGLDIDRIKVDMNDPDVDAEIKRNREIAKTLRLSGTPAFIVGTELVPGATDMTTLKSMLDDARHGVN